MTTIPIFPPSTGGVLIASPNSLVREQVLQSLESSTALVREASGGADALLKLESGEWQVLYTARTEHLSHAVGR